MATPKDATYAARATDMSNANNGNNSPASINQTKPPNIIKESPINAKGSSTYGQNISTKCSPQESSNKFFVPAPRQQKIVLADADQNSGAWREKAAEQHQHMDAWARLEQDGW